MNEFEDLLNSVSQVEPGDVVSAEVLTVDANQANVAISGTGVEGVLTLRELTNDRDADINDFVKVGEVLDVLVLRQVVGKDTDTVTYLVSKKRLEARKAWDKLVGREEEVVTVKAGIVEGEVMDAAGIKAIANLPNREGMLSMLLSVLQAPVRNVAYAVKAVAEAKPAE